MRRRAGAVALGILALSACQDSRRETARDVGQDIAMVEGRRLQLGEGHAYRVNSLRVFLYDGAEGNGLCTSPLPATHLSFHIPEQLGEYPLALGDAGAGGDSVSEVEFVSDGSPGNPATRGRVVVDELTTTRVGGRVELEADANNRFSTAFQASICAGCFLACSGATPLCDELTNSCVQCATSADCEDPAAASCAGGTCGSCQSDADCSHLAGTPACEAGVCVECTLENEASCSGTACDPATNLCTDFVLANKGDCEQCTDDRECRGPSEPDPDRRCVHLPGPRPESHCLRRAAKNCQAPFGELSEALSSQSGAPAEAYCAFFTSRTTCEAILDYVNGKPCTDRDECGCPSGGDCTGGGDCPESVCTIPCEDDAECLNICDDVYCD